jgi:hypothetical protein
VHGRFSGTVHFALKRSIHYEAYRDRHTTRYGFRSPVRLGPHTLLLRPREGHDLRIASSVLTIVPKAVLTWRGDLYDNVLGVAAFGEEPVVHLALESRVEVELYETTPLNFIVEEHALHFPFSYGPEELTARRPYLEPAYSDHRWLAEWLAPYRQALDNTETFAILPPHSTLFGGVPRTLFPHSAFRSERRSSTSASEGRNSVKERSSGGGTVTGSNGW